ncbi:hypothetical protein TNCV_2691671 [Trichonephila clavipes]|uniref:Uncharacterized protein n=1 Tax=Trichonephila clavipes TaxID=2585209 RepID=A0A8X7BAD2_TRICX|nr:hypothetical protein TNCV_2691671 [Trichonephila clavipes]
MWVGEVDLTEFERRMIEVAQSVIIGTSKMAALVKCSRVAVSNVNRGWITKKQTGSQRQANSRSKKQIEKIVQHNRIANVRQIEGNLN